VNFETVKCSGARTNRTVWQNSSIWALQTFLGTFSSNYLLLLQLGYLLKLELCVQLVEGLHQFWSGIYFWLGINQGIRCPGCWAWVDEKMHDALPGRAFHLQYACHACTSKGVCVLQSAKMH
jgi:hypothetical protein